MLEQALERRPWSISSLNTMQECGYKWKLRYIDRIEPEEKRDLPEFAFGRAVHKSIEDIHLSAAWDLIGWLRIWDANWKTEAKDVDWASWPGRQRNYERLGPELLALYTENSVNQSADIVSLEQSFEVEIQGMKFRGIIDQIRIDEFGLLLLDFKTSKEPLHPLVLRTDPQLTLYGYVTDLVYSGRTRVAHYYLRSGQILETRREEEGIGLVLAMAREAQERVDQNQLARQLGFHCQGCIYRGPCLASAVR